MDFGAAGMHHGTQCNFAMPGQGGFGGGGPVPGAG